MCVKHDILCYLWYHLLLINIKHNKIVSVEQRSATGIFNSSINIKIILMLYYVKDIIYSLIPLNMLILRILV